MLMNYAQNVKQMVGNRTSIRTRNRRLQVSALCAQTVRAQRATIVTFNVCYIFLSLINTSHPFGQGVKGGVHAPLKVK